MSELKFKGKRLFGFVLIVLLAIAVFIGGIEFQKSSVFCDNCDSLQKGSYTEVSLEEDLVSRCGEMPVSIPYSRFVIVKGLAWSPDCRNVAWSVWYSGVGGGLNEEFVNREGLLVYNDATKKSKLVYSPNEGETVEMDKWKDSKNVLFTKKVDDVIYSYNIEDNMVFPADR